MGAGAGTADGVDVVCVCDDLRTTWMLFIYSVAVINVADHVKPLNL